MGDASPWLWILGGLATGGVGLELLKRGFAKGDNRRRKAADERAALDAASVEFFRLQFEQINKDRDRQYEELKGCRDENRRLEDKLSATAAEFYELKGKYNAEKEQREQVSKNYFELLTKHTALLFEVEILRKLLADNNIPPPPMAALVAARTGMPTDSTGQ